MALAARRVHHDRLEDFLGRWGHLKHGLRRAILGHVAGERVNVLTHFVDVLTKAVSLSRRALRDLSGHARLIIQQNR